VYKYFLLIFSVLLFGAIGAAENCATAGKAKADSIQGSVKISLDQASWNDLKQGQFIDEKSFVKTEKGASLTLLFPDGSVLKAGEESFLNMKQILSSENCERKSYKIRVFFGKVWSNVKKIVTQNDKEENFTIETKNAVAGVRGTSFGFILNKDETGAVMVLAGAVEARNPKKEEVQEEAKPLDIQAWKKNRSKQEVAGPKEVSRETWESYILKAMQMIQFDSKGKFAKPVPIGEQNANEWYRENTSSR